jgi:hypothetical protein
MTVIAASMRRDRRIPRMGSPLRVGCRQVLRGPLSKDIQPVRRTTATATASSCEECTVAAMSFNGAAHRQLCQGGRPSPYPSNSCNDLQ